MRVGPATIALGLQLLRRKVLALPVAVRGHGPSERAGHRGAAPEQQRLLPSLWKRSELST